MIPIRSAISGPLAPSARTAVSAAAPRGLRWLMQAPHRLFFFLGVVCLLSVSAWWAAVLVARAAHVAWPLALAPMQLHATMMVHGFMPFFFWGFLFTAGPKWLAVPPPRAGELRGWALAAAAAVLAMPLAASVSAPAVAVASFVLAACWLGLAVRFARLVVASPVDDVVHAIVVLVALGLGAVGLLAFGAGLAAERPALLRLSVELGIWGFCAPVFVTVAHRMLPFFTANVLPFVSSWRPMWLLPPLVGGLWLHGAASLLGWAGARTAVDATMALLLAGLALRWGFMQSLSSQRLLTMLHLGFVWLAIAFALYAIDGGLALAGHGGLGLAPLHALTIGCFGSLVLAMVTRVSCGHSGRAVSADRTTWWLFVVFQAAAVLRIAAELQSSVGASTSLSVAAILVWLGAFGVWAVRYLPVYLSPRIDGRPG